MVKDNISNLINGLKNAGISGRSTMDFEYTKFNFSVLEKLKDQGFIEDLKIKGDEPKRTIKITLKYEDGKTVINGWKRVSKFSRRVYQGFKDINKVKSGYGIVLLTTPSGILTGQEAREAKTGGEVLFEIW